MSISEAPSSDSERYAHPLFALVDGEVVSLEGHLERGVESVLLDAYKERDKERPAGVVIRLANSPEELIEQ